MDTHISESSTDPASTDTVPMEATITGTSTTEATPSMAVPHRRLATAELDSDEIFAREAVQFREQCEQMVIILSFTLLNI
jgi:hypothetical protein